MAWAGGFFGSLGKAAQDAAGRARDNDQKMKDGQAKIYWDAIQSPDTPIETKQYAQSQLQKLYGGSKPVKELFEKFGQVLGVAHKHMDGANGGGQPPAAGQQAPAQMTPPPSGAAPADRPTSTGMSRLGGSGDGGTAATAPTTAPPKMTPPPQSLASVAKATYPTAESTYERQTQMEIGRRHAEVADRKQQAKDIGGLPENSPEWREYVYGIKPTTALNPHFQKATFRTPDGKMMSGSYDPLDGTFRDQQGVVVPDAELVSPGALTPKAIHYRGPDGHPLFGYQTQDGLIDAEGKPLPKDTPVFSAWMEPRDLDSWTWKQVTQPDGSIALVPVESTSRTTRGTTGTAGAAPPAGPQGGAAAPAASGKARRPGAPGGGTTVGGKVPPGVAKAYDTYNGALERFAVMQDALPRAMKNDQQAMLNLLANHIGMTMGLQKGARITQAIYEEAAQSAPWLSRVEAHFDKDGYLTGVVLTPAQMTQMIELAKVRLGQDEAAWQREIAAARAGYGMTGTPKAAPSKMTPPPGASSAPKTADDWFKAHPVAAPASP